MCLCSFRTLAFLGKVCVLSLRNPIFDTHTYKTVFRRRYANCLDILFVFFILMEYT